MSKSKPNKGQRSKKINDQKIYFQIKKIHHYVAYVVKPDWNVRELKALIAERLTNKQLQYIIDHDGTYYKDIKRAAFEELTERKILNKEMIHEDPIKVEKNYRKTRPFG